MTPEGSPLVPVLAGDDPLSRLVLQEPLTHRSAGSCLRSLNTAFGDFPLPSPHSSDPIHFPLPTTDHTWRVYVGLDDDSTTFPTIECVHDATGRLVRVFELSEDGVTLDLGSTTDHEATPMPWTGVDLMRTVDIGPDAYATTDVKITIYSLPLAYRLLNMPGTFSLPDLGVALLTRCVESPLFAGEIASCRALIAPTPESTIVPTNPVPMQYADGTFEPERPFPSWLRLFALQVRWHEGHDLQILVDGQEQMPQILCHATFPDGLDDAKLPQSPLARIWERAEDYVRHSKMQ